MVEEFRIEAFNPLSGLVLFAVVTVPDSWRVHASIYGTEVYRYVRGRECVLVTDGVSYHCLISPDGVAFDLKVTIKPRGKVRVPRVWERMWRKDEEGKKIEAFYWMKRAGVLKKSEKPHLTVLIECPEIERTMILEVSGPRLPLYLDLLYESLIMSRCR